MIGMDKPHEESMAKRAAVWDRIRERAMRPEASDMDMLTVAVMILAIELHEHTHAVTKE